MRLPQPGAGYANGGGAAGFSLLELIIASGVLLVGILSVVQLVPASLQSDLYNRYDTMATSVAQRELDQMVAQLAPCTTQTTCPPGLQAAQFQDRDLNSVSLGGSSGIFGGPVVMQGASAVIDFSANPVTGYNIPSYQDPSGSTFELRWAVISTPSPKNNGLAVAKRIIIGTRRTGCQLLTNTNCHPVLPVTLDSAVQK